jgi:CheY-like chemotaxis protein
MTGKLRVDFQPVDLGRVALAAVDVVSQTAEAKNVELVANLQSPVRPMMGDPDRLQQVVWNLLVNAIKFTAPGGRVTLAIEQSDGLLRLSVADTGEGIPPEFLPHLFERFQQADPSAHRRHAGLGLGLALVRQLVELHGGRISVTSTLGEGSTFLLSFPSRADLADVAGVGVAEVPAALDGNALAGIRALVIADDLDAREMFTIALDQHGATPVGVASVSEAVAVIRGEDPVDVVVSAVCDDDHASLLGTLQALSAEQGAAIPAIAITSDAHSALGARLPPEGYDLHMVRPIAPTALISAVLRLVGR